MKNNFIQAAPRFVRVLIETNTEKVSCAEEFTRAAIESFQLNSFITYFATTSPLMMAGGTPGPGTVS
jgi:hypothetical protein